MTDQTLGSHDGAPANDQLNQPLAQPAPAAGVRLERPARVPLGWLPPERGEFFLVSNQASVGSSEAQRARVREARDAVAARPAGIDQADLVSALPPELADHIARLAMTPPGAGMRTEGWDIAMIDLERVVAIQPSVFTDTATQRVAGLDPGDLLSIAELTLPINHTAPVSVEFDEFKQAYILTSPNPNLKVVANFNGPLPNGMPGFGFGVAVAASYVQVVRFQNRYMLRDGYHRAFGLLSRGITRVPAFIRDFDTAENLAPVGMLPQNTWLGDRPPLLRDYHDDRVAESVSLPARHRMIVIHALELFPTG
jgi:hypothetical protein